LKPDTLKGEMAVPPPVAPRATDVVGPVASPCVVGSPTVAVAADPDTGCTTTDDMEGETGW